MKTNLYDHISDEDDELLFDGYRSQNYIDESYNENDNYYEEIRDDYEISSDRLTILKV